MTNLQALESLIQIQNTNLAEKIMIDLQIDGTGTYTVADKSSIEIASAFVYKVQATHPDFKEANLSISIGRKEMIDYANSIFERYGYTDEIIKEVKPQIKIQTL